MNWKEAFSSHKSKSNDAMFNDISLEIGDWSKYLLVNKINNNVDKELEQFRSQQIIAKKHESTQTLERMKTLLAVNTEVNHRGSLCTELVMKDGTRLYTKTSTFDKNLSVTNKAKSLIGLKVKTSCWNPINKPRKWSNQGYFRNVYELSDFDQLNEAFKSKRNAIIYPPRDNWFKALEYSSFANTKVVILGQDPYHGEGQADGLSFSVPKGMKIPPSLNNIFEELENDDVEFIGPSHGNLASWAKQGVLLLNSALTVEKHSPSSHANIGWEYITDRVIRTLNDNKENIVFILWGLAANKKIDLIDTSKHKVLSASHPSPFSATKSTKDLTEFFGCKHFSQTNNYLKKNNIETINWSIPK
jgi:uracil-DNA glycosylase